MKKVLIIDDDQIFQKTITVKLEEKGFQAISATDGEEGFTKATTENPDLILLDIRMPKLDGIGLLKKLRADQDAPKTPILITSNLATVEKISEGIALGVKGYIIKSNETLDTIVKEVENILK